MNSWLITMACGHTGYSTGSVRIGEWISCWAVMHPERGCQTQRKVINVTEVNTPVQGALF